MNVKIQWKRLLLHLAIPLAVGGLAGFLTKNSMETFQNLQQPPFSPPGWLFPVAWTILYLLMGLASYLVHTAHHPPRGSLETADLVYALQLAANFLWPIVFFNWGLYLPAFFWLIFLWVLILANLLLFYRIQKTAGYLLIPYLLWVTFAGYLNLSIYLLNK